MNFNSLKTMVEEKMRKHQHVCILGEITTSLTIEHICSDLNLVAYFDEKQKHYDLYPRGY